MNAVAFVVLVIAIVPTVGTTFVVVVLYLLLFAL